MEADLLELGYQIVAVSPDRPEKVASVLSKLDGDYSYELLSDSKMEASSGFGLTFKVSDETRDRYARYSIDLEDASGETHHLLPVPAVFILDTEGTILFTYVNPNYRERIDPHTLLAAARAAAG